MRTTELKLTLLSGATIGFLTFAGLESGCQSPRPGASTKAATHLHDPADRRGATDLLQDDTRDKTVCLETIPISCPTEPKYRLPGFAMKCVDCHQPHSKELAGREFDACAANLKYIGLAAQTWAQRHKGALPADFSSMANELRSPMVAVCPTQVRETREQIPFRPQIVVPTPWCRHPKLPKTNAWDVLDRKHATYQIVAQKTWRREPASDYVRCLVHSNVLRADGSVVAAGGTH